MSASFRVLPDTFLEVVEDQVQNGDPREVREAPGIVHRIRRASNSG